MSPSRRPMERGVSGEGERGRHRLARSIAPRLSSCAPANPSGVWTAATRIPPLEMRLHDSGKRRFERRRRARSWVRRAARAGAQRQAGEQAQRDACPAGAAAAGKSITWAKPSAASAASCAFREEIAGQHCRGEGEVLAGGQRGLNSISVAEVMRLFADRAFAIAAVQRKATGFDRQEAGERPEQARFPGSVGPGHHQAQASGRLEPRKSGVNSPPPALDRQVPGSQPHWVSVRGALGEASGSRVHAPTSP